MITSFADRRTEELFGREHVKGLSAEVQRAGLRKRLILDSAARIVDFVSRRETGWKRCGATCMASIRSR